MSQQAPRREPAKTKTSAEGRPSFDKLGGAPHGPADAQRMGMRLRSERGRKGLTLREFARRISVSPSLVSQIERGLVTPSVGTLWSMTTELGLAMDELFNSVEQKPRAHEYEAAADEPRRGPVQRGHDRKRIRLAGGVVWERLTAEPDDEVEFLYVTYEPGAESCPEDSLFRHGGREYAYVLAGRLGVQVGFEKYELQPGDSLSFTSQIPHRLWAIGGEPAVAIWAVVDRSAEGGRDR